MINKSFILRGAIGVFSIAVLVGGIAFLNYWRTEGFLKLITFSKNIEGNQKLIALTFDDGPYGETTNKILDILKEKKVKATFFVVGKNAEEYPDILKREIEEGHVVGNHSFDHSKFLNLFRTNRLIKNIEDAEDTINAVAGVRPRFFRPPYGLISPLIANEIKGRGYIIILWNDATDDYHAKESSREITDSILKKLKPGAIIDLHDGRDVQLNYSRVNLIEALPIIIDKIREEGYTFVTIDRIIGEKPYF